MTFTLKTIIAAIPSLGKLASASLPLKTAYSLKKNLDLLQKEADFFSAERRKIAEKYGTVFEDGSFSFTDEMRDSGQKAMEELLDMTVEMAFERISITVSEEVLLSVNDLQLLLPFIDFTEERVN